MVAPTKSSRNTFNWVTLLLAFGLSLLAACFIFADLFWLRNQSFMWHHDAEIPFENTFTIISFFFQGGISLFDHFDSFNYAYTQLSSGFYTMANCITALLYVIFFPFYQDPGQAYHHCFSIVFHSTTMLIRTIGGYLLLSRMGLNRTVIIASLVILNTFLSSTMYFGLLTDNLYSYFPLLAFFILNFFEHYRLKDFCAAFLVFVVCVANSPLFALGYFYEPVHFLIVAAAVSSFIFHRRNMKFKAILKKETFQKIGLCVVLAGLVFLPIGVLATSLSKDFYVPNSGMQGTDGRLKAMFNPQKYFSPKSETLIPPKEMPFKVVDFTNDWWEKSWIFWGAGIIGFALLGLIASCRREKYIFGAVLVLIVLSNTRLDPHSIWSLAHWINALTNPFSFLLRSYHMPILLMPFVLFVPVALGLQVLSECFTLGHQKIHVAKRIIFVWGVGVLLAIANTLPVPVKAYAVGVFAIFMTLAFMMLIPLSKKLRMLLGGVLLLAIVSIDSIALWKYYINNQYHGRYFTQDDGRHLKPRFFSGFGQAQPLTIEYQNPTILPWREYVRLLPTQTTPAMHSEQNHYGYFYKYLALERFLQEPNIYAPRPSAFKDIATDMDAIRLLAQDPRFITLSDQQQGGNVQNLGRYVARFDFSFNNIDFKKHKDFLQCQWPLPNDFPAFTATGVFTLDKDLLRAVFNAQTLTPVQGAITAPYQYDVNNIRKGYLTVGLPLTADVRDSAIQLFTNRSKEIVSIKNNTLDTMRFEYLALTPGFLKTRLAFDDKWHIVVDGKEMAPVKVDGYFLGVHIGQGQHTITLQYWPNMVLRWLIIVSVVLTFIILGWTIFYGFRSI